MLRDFSDDLVPLLSPAKGGGTQAVRVVLTGSKEDRETFEVVTNHNPLEIMDVQASYCRSNLAFNDRGSLKIWKRSKISVFVAFER